MIGINAWSIIAFVQNKQPFWDGAMMKPIAKAMSHVIASSAVQDSISPSVSCASPLPTVIRAALVNIAPKAFFGWGGQQCIVMAPNKMKGVSLFVSALWITVFGYWCELTAAAKAIAVGDFIKRKLGLGKLWGMIRHSNSPFVTLLTPRDISRCRRGNSFTPVSIPYLAGGA